MHTQDAHMTRVFAWIRRYEGELARQAAAHHLRHGHRDDVEEVEDIPCGASTGLRAQHSIARAYNWGLELTAFIQGNLSFSASVPV